MSQPNQHYSPKRSYTDQRPKERKLERARPPGQEPRPRKMPPAPTIVPPPAPSK